jgi:endonuclease G, mitochondrial
VWVVTGPAFLPKKEGSKWIMRYEVLGDSEPNVAVPTHFWKVILTQKGSNMMLASLLLPNERIDDSTPIEQFLVPLSKIEKATGLIFFENLRGNLSKDQPLQLPLLCSSGKCKLPPPLEHRKNSHG